MTPQEQLRTCPQRAKHTPCPETYDAWHEWADKKMRTHRQVRCPGCRLWAIWVPKIRRVKRAGVVPPDEPPQPKK